VTPGPVRFGPKFEFKPQNHVYYSVYFDLCESRARNRESKTCLLPP
jgi:hypothetical protein